MSLDLGTHGFARCGDIRIHYVERRPDPDAPLVVLLHGFLTSGYAWRNQLTALGNAGYRVVAPDLRGYGKSDKPRALDAYRIDVLADDVADLIESLGASSASIVGHGWGGLIAWWHAMRHPQQVASLSVLNAPHPAHQSRMLSDPAQVKKLGGLLALLLPRIPEWSLRRHDNARIRALLQGHPSAFSHEDVERYVAALDAPSLAAALNYPRAYLRGRSAPTSAMRPIDRPTQVLWGDADPYLCSHYADPPSRWVWDVRLETMPGRGHWLPLEAADEVNRRLLGFLPSTRDACTG